MKQRISCQISTWIPPEELPVKPTLRVIRKSHPDYGLTQEEIEERNEHIRCYLLKQYELLLSIPAEETENDFFVEDYQESAFNTYDYERHHPRKGIDKYAYKNKKILEHVMDLATMHSSITSPQGRENTHTRYQTVLQNEYREKIIELAKRHELTNNEAAREELKSKIGKLNRTLLECKKVWERYAPPEHWDP